MGLGQLYKPRGLARETAQQVLEVSEPYAENIALGCSNGCLYCYGPRYMHTERKIWLNVRHPKKEPAELVKDQLDSGLKPQGVFLCFGTDPFLTENRASTERVITLLKDCGIGVATSSKVDLSEQFGIRHGMTIVSLDEEFSKFWEPKTPSPRERLRKLEEYSDLGEYVWVSMEPCPCPAIWKQNLGNLLEELKFVNFIIKGKWNYDPRANTEQSRQDYAEIMQEFVDFCKGNRIRHHVKSDTTKFINGE